MSDSARADDGHAGSPTKQGVGARLERKEGARLLRGRGQYVGAIRLAGMREVAFVRSPVAHAVVGRIDIPDGRRSDVFVGRDLADVEPILCVAGLPGFKAASQPVLAVDRVLHVGMAVAMCVGDTRAQAEDLAEALAVDYRELDVVHDVRKAREPGATLLHGSWGDNLLLTSDLVVGDVDAVARSAPVSVELELRTARQCMSPMEGRGVLAAWDSRMDQLVVHTSSQVPHLVRAGLARFLGLEEGHSISPTGSPSSRARSRRSSSTLRSRCASRIRTPCCRLYAATSATSAMRRAMICRRSRSSASIMARSTGSARGVGSSVGSMPGREARR